MDAYTTLRIAYFYFCPTNKPRYVNIDDLRPRYILIKGQRKFGEKI